MLELLNNPIIFVIYALSLVVAITIHEFAHAWTADRLGDPTPKLQGRLTLNPLAHLDPIGTLMIFLVRFGWGKPVQFDPYNLQNPKRDAAIISLAGPVANIVLASILSLIVWVFPSTIGYLLFVPMITLNVFLAVFNLIPVHPLDGGKILVGMLPAQVGREVDLFLNQFGMILLIFILLPFFGGTPLVHRFVSPVADFLLSILLPGAGAFI